MEKALVYINYPELIPLNHESTEYDGYITIDVSINEKIFEKLKKFPGYIVI